MLKRYVQVEHLISTIIRDCRGLDSPAEVISAMQRHKESSFDPAFGAGDSSQTMYKVHGDDSLIVSHGRERLSFWKRFAFNGFKSFTGAIPGTLNKRRWKIQDALTDKLVGCIVVIHFIPRLVLASPFSGDRERFGVSSHRIEESLTILASQLKLECYRPKHIIYVGD